ncbi:MAG: PqqD family peptide modification chaperone [Candidatus Pacebacteria bacterium]|nr:PqqD family peptide modification chaperone [Candidatus Paceibacterota bacterium]
MHQTNLFKVIDMELTHIPTFVCRVKTRKDIEEYIGFFQGIGVLNLNEKSEFIVKKIDGTNTIADIVCAYEKEFPESSEYLKEVFEIISQFKEAQFLI